MNRQKQKFSQEKNGKLVQKLKFFTEISSFSCRQNLNHKNNRFRKLTHESDKIHDS